MRVAVRVAVKLGVVNEERHGYQAPSLDSCRFVVHVRGRWEGTRTPNRRFWRPLEHICCLPHRMRCGLVLTDTKLPDKMVGKVVGRLTHFKMFRTKLVNPMWTL